MTENKNCRHSGYWWIFFSGNNAKDLEAFLLWKLMFLLIYIILIYARINENIHNTVSYPETHCAGSTILYLVYMRSRTYILKHRWVLQGRMIQQRSISELLQLESLTIIDELIGLKFKLIGMIMISKLGCNDLRGRQ